MDQGKESMLKVKPAKLEICYFSLPAERERFPRKVSMKKVLKTVSGTTRYS